MAKKFNLSDYIEADPERFNLNHMEITPIPLGMIDTNWKNFYSVDFQEVDLAESIKISGLLTPLGVIAGPGGRWKLISGHRRYRALRYLRDTEPDGRERWDTVPCVIYPSPEDADREELMLIHANAQRIKNGSEIAKEAEKTLQILTRMKERGVELPGRMRDRVAEALQVSSARLARLDAIKKNLTYPGWVRAWEKQEINEAVAYRLSQLDYSQQMNAADWVIDHNIAHKDVTVKNIEEALAHPPLTNPGCADPLAYETDVVKVDRELARRAGFLGYFSGARFANRKDGMDQLKVTFRHAGRCSDGLHWNGDPKGIRFEEPVEWLLSWGALYDALAANALDAAIEAATTEKPKPALVKLKEEPRAVETPAPARTEELPRNIVNDLPGAWHRLGEEDPKDGELIATTSAGGAWMADIWRWHDGRVYNPNDRSFRKPCEIDTGDSLWTPLPEFPEEDEG